MEIIGAREEENLWAIAIIMAKSSKMIETREHLRRCKEILVWTPDAYTLRNLLNLWKASKRYTICWRLLVCILYNHIQYLLKQLIYRSILPTSIWRMHNWIFTRCIFWKEKSKTTMYNFVGVAQYRSKNGPCT